MTANKDKINELLDSWKEIVRDNAKKSQYNASKFYKKNGNENRIKIPASGNLIVYDYPTFKKHCLIQNELCLQIPELKDLINSKPDIFDFEWKIEDYIELCYYHYMIVIEKIKEKLNE
jgi:hypothetical protein